MPFFQNEGLVLLLHIGPLGHLILECSLVLGRVRCCICTINLYDHGYIKHCNDSKYCHCHPKTVTVTQIPTQLPSAILSPSGSKRPEPNRTVGASTGAVIGIAAVVIVILCVSISTNQKAEGSPLRGDKSSSRASHRPHLELSGSYIGFEVDTNSKHENPVAVGDDLSSE